jgi:Ca-activated chloride channel homolog
MRGLFADIELVWLLCVPIGLAALYLWAEARRRAITAQLVDQKLLPVMVVDRSGTRRFWKAALRVLAALALAVGLLRPQWGSHTVEMQRKGIDIVFAIDTSKSMLAQDVQPNRIERVKQDVRYFANQVVQQDRMALVGFAGTARVLCPLTLDRSAFDLFLDELDVGSVPLGGTNLQAALEECVQAFGDEERNHKAIILFTDGESHEDVSDELLAEVRQKGVRVYTVGIGNEEGVRIPIKGSDGQTTFLKDGEGNIVLTRLDDKTLKTIAQKSLDGAYTHLAAGRANLAKIYEDNIKKIEERELKSAKRVRRYERFQWFLGAALVLLALEALIANGAKDAGKEPS